MADKPTKKTQIPVKAKRAYKKRVQVKAVVQTPPKPPVQPAFATPEEAPTKRPLGRPRKSAPTAELKVNNVHLQREVNELRKQLRASSQREQEIAQRLTDHRDLVERLESTWLGRRLVKQAKHRMPWGRF